MCKRIFLGLIIIGVCGVSVLAQDKDKEDPLSLVYEQVYPEFEKTKDLKEVEYTPLFLTEGKFSAQEVKTIGIKTNLKGEKKTLSMCYPKVVLKEVNDEKELLFLDKLGKIIKRYPLEWEDVFWSENKKYLCFYRDKKIVVIDSEGKELWSYKYLPISDIHVSPNGDYVIEEPDVDYGGYDEIEIHYQTGKHKKIELPPTGLPFYLDISENGEYFCVTIGAYLLLFDKYGKEMWRREGGFGREYCYFLKNEFIGAMNHQVIGDEEITYFNLFDIKGNLLWRNRVFSAVEDVCYLKDEGKVYVLSAWGHFFLFDVKNGKLLAKYSDENAPVFKPPLFSGKGIWAPSPLAPNWRGIIINPNFDRIITHDLRKYYYKGETERVELFDKDLRKLGQKEYPRESIKINFLEPVIRFSNDNLLSIMTKEGLKTYEIK
ncbi:MAG: hypothetical protein AB1414_05520 [bacterium]